MSIKAKVAEEEGLLAAIKASSSHILLPCDGFDWLSCVLGSAVPWDYTAPHQRGRGRRAVSGGATPLREKGPPGQRWCAGVASAVSVPRVWAD